MGRFNLQHPHWDEFRWEQEIRSDEKRISGYFRELAGCLDLPDEEELILGQLSSQGDLVPSPEAAESLRSWMSGNDDDSEEGEDPVNTPRRTVESATVDELDMLSAEWCICCAGKMPPHAAVEAMGCNCALAKLLARAADFLEPGSGASPALLISLGKRAVCDLDDAVIRLRKFGEHYSGSCTVGKIISRLGEIRERLIVRVSALRE